MGWIGLSGMAEGQVLESQKISVIDLFLFFLTHSVLLCSEKGNLQSLILRPRG